MDQSIKEFKFDLDAKPQDRWVHIIESYSPVEITSLVNFGRKLLEPYRDAMSYFEYGLGLYPPSGIMYLGELNCIAEMCKLSLLEVLALQLIYEAHAACTTGIWQVNGKPHLFRTMDWETIFLRRFTIKLNVYHHNKLIGEAVTWLGFVGFFTASSWQHNYSVMVNYRRTSENLTMTNLGKNLIRLVVGCYPIAYLVRNTVNVDNYENALKKFETTSLISPCYLTIYHHLNYEKSRILTRDHDGLVSSRQTLLIQTNCDHDKILPNILHSLQRRKLASEIIATCPTNYGDFLKFPILNDETIYVYFMTGNTSQVHVIT